MNDTDLKKMIVTKTMFYAQEMLTREIAEYTDVDVMIKCGTQSIVYTMMQMLLKEDIRSDTVSIICDERDREDDPFHAYGDYYQEVEENRHGEDQPFWHTIKIDSYACYPKIPDMFKGLFHRGAIGYPILSNDDEKIEHTSVKVKTHTIHCPHCKKRFSAPEMAFENIELIKD